jgi:glycosyltransferase involved in cell wall biosynthesis
LQPVPFDPDVKPKALIVCQFSPYPVVTGGYERLIADWQAHVFDDYDTWFLCNRQTQGPNRLFHRGVPISVNPTLVELRAHDFALALFVNPLDDEPEVALADDMPSFCFLERQRSTGRRFLGTITHSGQASDDVLVIGGSFDGNVFFKRRSAEEAIVCVARICAAKNQIELVRGYRERIYERFGLPLILAGGADPPIEMEAIAPYIDGQAVRSTGGWIPARDVAELLNRARLFVNPSPKESFCIALVEAMACGTTCVVNGRYDGFDPAALRAHVTGSIDGPRGSILDHIEAALLGDVRIDVSGWAQQFSLRNARRAIRSFMEQKGLPACV